MPHTFKKGDVDMAIHRAADEISNGNAIVLATAYSDLYRAAYASSLARNEADDGECHLDEDAAKIAADRCATYTAGRIMARVIDW